jgi:hypothetical protein
VDLGNDDGGSSSKNLDLVEPAVDRLVIAGVVELKLKLKLKLKLQSEALEKPASCCLAKALETLVLLGLTPAERALPLFRYLSLVSSRASPENREWASASPPTEPTATCTTTGQA